jgi:putative hemolysin
MDAGPRSFAVFSAVPWLVLLYLYFLMAISAVNRSRGRRIRELTESRTRPPRIARLILFRAEQFLQSLHAGLFLVAMLLGYGAITATGSDGLWGWIVDHYPPLSSSAPLQLTAKVFFFLIVAAGALVGTVLAKALAYALPERILLILASSILVSHRILMPLVIPVKAVARRILALFSIGLPTEFERPLSAEELSEMVELSTKAGEIEQDEQEMIESVFDFNDTLVEEVMTPRGNISWISVDADFDTVIETFKTEGFSRLVVIGKDLDDVRGVLLAKDVFGWFSKDRSTFAINRIMRKPFFVQHSRKIGELLKDMRRDKSHLSIVLDEHGGVDGIVTVEDLVEELVGEIHDEFDHGETSEVLALDRDDLILEGSASIDDINDRFSLSIPHGEYDTIAGFMLTRMGRIPHRGESLYHEGLLLTVGEVEQNRITVVRIQRNREADEVNSLNGSSPVVQPVESTQDSAELPVPEQRASAANLK